MCAHACVFGDTVCFFTINIKCHCLLVFLVYAAARYLSVMSVFMCEQKGSRKGLWIVQETLDKLCERGRDGRVGSPYPSTVCNMFDPVQHNSQHIIP